LIKWPKNGIKCPFDLFILVINWGGSVNCGNCFKQLLGSKLLVCCCWKGNQAGAIPND